MAASSATEIDTIFIAIHSITGGLFYVSTLFKRDPVQESHNSLVNAGQKGQIP
jgi:hypothetical protein